MTKDKQDDLTQSLQSETVNQDYFTGRENALLAYAEKLTEKPATINADDIAALRNVGLDDRAIHDACVVVAYFAFVNRIADGLGVELEELTQK